MGSFFLGFVSAEEAQASVSIVILERVTENVSNWGIFEPLCCNDSMGVIKTGDWCLENDKFNMTTLEGDVYCEGARAGANIAVNLQHVLRFNFTRITVGSDDMIQCLVEQSNGTLINITKTGLTLNNANYILNYAISNDTTTERNVSASVHDLPWGIHNCSIINGTGQYDYPINEVVFVRRNTDWSTFDYQKAVFAESVPYRFFNNTRALKKYFIETGSKSYSRYLSFKHYAGANTEEFCFDGKDNDEDLIIDYDDYDCRTFTHRYESDDMNFTIPNFLATLSFFERVMFRITGYDVSTAESDNIAEGSLGGVSYMYTLNTNNDGSFKIRFYESSPGSSGYGYTIKNVPNVSSVEMIETLPSGASSAYFCGASAGLPEGLCNINLDCSACGSGAIDFVYIINSSDTEFDSTSIFTLEVVHGTVIDEGNFTAYFDPDEGLTNNNESETSSAVSNNNLCADGVNNDLDIASSSYTYLTGLSFSNQIVLARDCADEDCDGRTGPTQGSVSGKCEYLVELNCTDGYDNDFNDNYTTDAYGLSGIYYTDCHDADCFHNGDGLGTCPTTETVCGR